MAKRNFDKAYFAADPEPAAHPERIEAAIERTHRAIAAVPDDQMTCVSIRLDDLQKLLDHIETLTAEFEQAQRCVLEEACETIEFIGSIMAPGAQRWQDYVSLIHANLPPRPEDRLIEPRRSKRKPVQKPRKSG